ncbi:unnamed protein product [Calypogeia fissa]
MKKNAKKEERRIFVTAGIAEIRIPANERWSNLLIGLSGEPKKNLRAVRWERFHAIPEEGMRKFLRVLLCFLVWQFGVEKVWNSRRWARGEGGGRNNVWG